MKRMMICIVLAASMLFSLAACGAAAPGASPAPTQAAEATPAPAEASAQPAAVEAPSELSDIDTQLKLIHQNLDKMLQPSGELPWFYTVTDLDHDGSLEFVAAS